MIPESAGATPYGIFLLAHDYLSAAGIVVRESTDLSGAKVLRYCQAIRSSVIKATRFRKAITGLARYHRTIQSEV